jgi:hypothetical protein
MTPQNPKCGYGTDCPREATVILHVDYPATADRPAFRYSKMTCTECAAIEGNSDLATISTEPLQASK